MPVVITRVLWFPVVGILRAGSPFSPARDSPTFLSVTAPSSTSFRVTTLCVEAESFCSVTTYCSNSLQIQRKLNTFTIST